MQDQFTCLCACGCGANAPPNRRYRPGHNNNWVFRPAPRLSVACAHCGTVVTVVGSHAVRKVEGGTKPYCSRSCKAAGQRKPLVGVNCTECGKSLEVHPSRALRQERHFCGRPCWTAFRSRMQTGAGHPMFGRRGDAAPNWRGGVTSPDHLLRSSLEYRQWRDAVLRRDGFACCDCGEGDPCLLQAHHETPIATAPERATDIDNGVTLCKTCHGKRHEKAATSRSSKVRLAI